MHPWGTYQPNGFAAHVMWAARAGLMRGAVRKAAVRAATKHGPCDVEVDGIRLRCHPADNLTEQSVVVRGTTRTLALALHGLAPGDVFVDAGANCGVFTTFAARIVGPTGRVLAVEPIPAMVGRLRFNLAANGLENRVTVASVALGAEPGTETLYVHGRNYGQSSMVGTGDALQVPVLPLATVVKDAGLSRIDSLKIDIEGWEDRALVPYFQTMPKAMWPRRVCIEVVHADRWRTDCVVDMLSKGYTVHWTDNRDCALVLEPGDNRAIVAGQSHRTGLT